MDGSTLAMTEPQLSTPLLHVGGTSYEAPQGERLSSSAPPVAAPEAAPPDVVETSVPEPPPRSQPRRRVPRVRELFEQISQRRNEFIELLLGPYSRSGWFGSLCVHGLALVALALLLVPAERKEPPRIITGGVDLDGPGDVGNALSEIELDDARPVPIESAADVLASGGSQGDLRPDLTAAFGRPTGRGNGFGSGDGDADGDAIAGRVKAAGGKGGSLQVSIGWSDRNDLDLHVVTPGGRRIYYAQPLSPDGGELDVDMNIHGETTQPVENITWGTRTPPDGVYLVQVYYYKRNPGGPPRSSFKVRVQVGDEVRIVAGTSAEQRLTQVAQFEVRDGAGVSLTTDLQEQDEADLQLSVAESKRSDNRERAAAELLTDARGTADSTLRAGKLRRLVQKFSGTEAAATAKQLLDGGGM